MRAQRVRAWGAAQLVVVLCLVGASAGGGEEGESCDSHRDCAQEHYCNQARECSPCRDEDGEAPCDLWHDALDGSCAACGGDVGAAAAGPTATVNSSTDSELSSEVAGPNSAAGATKAKSSFSAADAIAAFNPLGLPQPAFMPTFTDRGFAVVSTPTALHAHMVEVLRRETDLGRLVQEPPNWKRKAEYNIIPRHNHQACRTRLWYTDTPRRIRREVPNSL